MTMTAFLASRAFGSSSASTARLKVDRQRLQATNRQGLLVLEGLSGQSRLSQAPEQGSDRNLALRPCEYGADAEVNAKSKCHVPVRMPSDVEPVGFGKLRLIAICGRNHKEDALAFANSPAPEFDVVGSHALSTLDGSFITQQFFDTGSDRRAIAS
jgi:hypothetical protein